MLFRSVLKQIHHEPCSYYTFGNKIQSELNDYERLKNAGLRLPSDITGLNVYSQKDGEFHLVKGPVFTNVLLADEINRATPRTQASLLEAMEEKQVTIDGETLPLAEPFLVVATENPIETTGTYPLPEAQVDRFMMKLSMGQLDTQAKLHVMETFMGEHPLLSLKPVCTAEQIAQMREAARTVTVHPCIREYIVQIVEETGKNQGIMTEDRKSTRLNSSHIEESRMPSSA